MSSIVTILLPWQASISICEVIPGDFSKVYLWCNHRKLGLKSGRHDPVLLRPSWCPVEVPLSTLLLSEMILFLAQVILVMFSAQQPCFLSTHLFWSHSCLCDKAPWPKTLGEGRVCFSLRLQVVIYPLKGNQGARNWKQLVGSHPPSRAERNEHTHG